MAILSGRCRDKDPAMRRLFLLGCIIFFTVAAPLMASAQTACPEAPAKIAAILAQYPNGGAGLSAAIAQAVEADPCSARAAVSAALSATAAQQQAIGLGLAAAATFFANLAAGGGPDAGAAGAAEQLILAALASAPGLTQAAFAAANGFPALATTLGGGGPNLTTNSCVSPSAPGGSC
jgi:hypothetical protein